MLQFLRYGICGGISTIFDSIIFFLAAWLLFPALTNQDFLVQLLGISVELPTEKMRAINFILANSLAFIFSNMAAYILNSLFVFQSNKKRRYKEIAIFYFFSTIVVLLSIGISMMMMKFLMLSTTLAYLIKVIFSVTVNFVARKNIVFAGV